MRRFARQVITLTLAPLAALPAGVAAQSAPAGSTVASIGKPPLPRGVSATKSTIVLLVRHAEKAAEPADDPPLSAAGSERARALAGTLADAGVTAVVVTPRLRTRATAQPLATARGLTPDVVPLAGTPAAHAQAVADAVRRHAGGVVLVIGHSNTVPGIIAALGGPKLPDLCDAAYSNLFLLVLEGEGGAGTGAAPARLVRSHYGAPDPAGAAGCATMAPR